ncbi:MAG TPA: type II secretion system F family protein [Caldisericia bacterium]|jgi:tight adherence protein B|nr:type II secretion system F family protein [Caldisericia bacterium]
MNRNNTSKEELFEPYYQSKEAKRLKRDSAQQIREGSVQDILKLSMNTITFLFLFSLICLGIFFIFFFVFDQNIVMGLLFVALSLIAFQIFIQMKKGDKENRFVNQLPDTLSAVANSLKAGFSLDQAFEFVSMSMPEPSKSEFSKIHLNYRVGLTLKDSLEDLTQKYPNTEVKLFVSSLVLQSQVGGNVIPFLEELKVVLKERVKLRRSIAVGTAQTRLSTAIIALLPYVILMILVSSGWSALTNTLKGILLLIFAILMQVTGLFINSQLMKIDL